MDRNQQAVQAVMRQCMQQVEAGWMSPDASIDSLIMRDQLSSNAAAVFADELIQAPYPAQYTDLLQSSSGAYADRLIEAPQYADMIKSTEVCRPEAPQHADLILDAPQFADRIAVSRKNRSMSTESQFADKLMEAPQYADRIRSTEVCRPEAPQYADRELVTY